MNEVRILTGKELEKYILEKMNDMDKTKEIKINNFYENLLTVFMEEVKNMLSVYEVSIQVSREKNFLKRKISYEITKVYKEVINQKEEK